MSYIGTEPKDIRSFGRTKFDYTATQGQTAFTGADDDGKVLAFTEGQIEVYVNGILMDDSDFTTTGTGTVTLASAANLNDVINIVSFETNIPDSNYVPASGGTFSGNVTNSGNVTVGGTLGVTGATTLSGNTTVGGTLGVTGNVTHTGTTTANNDIIANKHLRLYTTDDQTNQWYVYTNTDDTLRFNYNGAGNDEITVATDGDVGIGTSSPTGNANSNARVLEVYSSSGSNPPEILAGGQNAEISIAGGSASSYLWSTGNYPITFATNGTARMSLLNNGYLDNNHAFIATRSGSSTNTSFYNSGYGIGIYAYHGYGTCGDHIEVGTDATDGWANIYLQRTWNVGEDSRMISFNVNSGVYGSITTTTSGTAYNTSSDHRMKENVEDLTDGITRVKQLQPKRFNFIDDETNTLVDGFMAHEAQTVVAEAVSGTHNEVDDDGNPVMQQIDQAKLVPLLTAALQEAIAKIETLETKVAALEAG